MSTQITVTVGSRALIEKAQEEQAANRAEQLEKERQARITRQLNKAEAEKAEKEQRGADEEIKPIDRKVASAQRLPSGIFAAEVTTRYDASTDTFYVKASVPGVEGSVEVPTTDSGRGSVSTAPPVIDPSIFTAYGRVFKYVNDWAIYRDGSFGGGTNFSDPTAEPPRASNQTDYSYQVSKRTTDLSRSLLLPLSGKDGVLVYVYNRIEIFNRYTRATNKVYRSVNERNIRSGYEWGMSGYQADWDAEGHTRIKSIFADQEAFSVYEILAFYVSDKGVKQISVPDSLVANLEEVYPPAAANGSSNFYYLDEINYDSYYAHDYSSFVDVTFTNYQVTYQVEPGFSETVWQQSSRYGVLSPDSLALPQHFGLGYLNTSSHAGPFFTPAVYRFLLGPMNLDNTTAQAYATMRGNYFPSAPFRFYAPCARTASCKDNKVKEFDLTSTQPTNATTALAANQFRRNKATDVTIGVPQGLTLYSWNWDQPAQCRQQLLAIGFRPSDLVP